MRGLDKKRKYLLKVNEVMELLKFGVITRAQEAVNRLDLLHTEHHGQSITGELNEISWASEAGLCKTKEQMELIESQAFRNGTAEALIACQNGLHADMEIYNRKQVNQLIQDAVQEHDRKTLFILQKINMSGGPVAVLTGFEKLIDEYEKALKGGLCLLVLMLCSLTLSAQVIPSVGLTAERQSIYPTYNVEIVRGGEKAGISTLTGWISQGAMFSADDVHIFVGAYFCGNRHTFLEARVGFAQKSPALNLGFKYMPVRPLVTSLDVTIKERPAIGLKVGLLIGDIHFVRHRKGGASW